MDGCSPGDNSAICRGVPNTLVPHTTVLKYTCESGYQLADEKINFTFCLQGTWNPEPPKCASKF